MKHILLCGFLFAACCLSFGQVSPQITGAGAPTNPCFNGGQQYWDTTNKVLYLCSVAGSNWVNLGIGNQQVAVSYVTSAPSGSCSGFPPIQVLNPNGTIYTCQSGTWGTVGGGGGSGTVSANNGSAGAVANYAAAGGSTTVGPDANLTDASNALTYSGTSGVTASAGTLTSGTAGTTGGSLTLAGATSGTVTLTSPAVSGTRSNAATLSNSLTVNGPQVTVSTATAGNGVLALSGNTSGTVTLTAPATAGTVSNAATFSNSLIVSGPQVTVSVAGNGNGVLALSGNTSGTATLTAPGTAGTSTNPIVISNVLNSPLGAVGTVAYGNSTNANSGLYFVNGTSPAMASAGAAVAMFQGAAIRFGSTVPHCWTSGDATAACDTGISRLAADVLQFGNGTANDETQLLRWNTCKPTSAATMNVSGTAVTICSWTLPASAKTWSFQCTGTYTTTTASDTFAIGINAAQAPTSETGNAKIYSTATGTMTSGSNTGTSSGALNILTGASVSSVTSIPWEASGTIQASATSGTFTVTGTLTGTSPSGTVNVGSTCILY